MRKILDFIAFLIIVTSTVHGQNIDQLLTDYTNDGKAKGIRENFNGVVLIAKDNNIVFNKAYGYSDFESKKELSVNDKFLIGSVTKPIVAYLTLKQVEYGNIKLDQPISDLLPNFDYEKGKKITVRMLMNHTSGIPHYSGVLPYVESRKEFLKSAISTDDYVSLISKIGLLSIPGKKYHYSSLGYILLGAILEKVTKQSFSEIVKKEINQKLGLKNLGFVSDISKHIVKDYKIKDGNYKEFPNRHQSNVFTAGGLHANSIDLFRFFNRLKKGDILNSELKEEMFKENTNGYALGLHRNEPEVLRYIPSARYFSHGGSVNDFSSYVMVNDDGTTIIILTNTAPLNRLKLLTNIYRTYKGEDLSISNRVILPSLKNVSRFEEENGIDGVIQYQQVMTKNAGFPVYPSANYILKMVKIHRNKINVEAIDSLIETMTRKENPNAENTLNRLGYLLLKIDSKKAGHYFKKATKLFPKSANAWDSFGEYNEKNNKKKLAKIAYKKAVNLAEKYHLENLNLYKKNLKRIKDEL